MILSAWQRGESMKIKVYIAKANTWFDAGTVAIKRTENFGSTPDSALFIGSRRGEPDEEVCEIDEFDVIELDVTDVDYKETRSCSLSIYGDVPPL